MHLVEDAVHRILDGARYRAVDRAGRRLVGQRAGVGSDPPGRNRAATQRPEESFEPVLAFLRRGLRLGQGAGHALVGLVDAAIDRLTQLAGQAVLLFPDVLGCRLHRNIRGRFHFYRLQPDRAHYRSFSRSNPSPKACPEFLRPPTARVAKPERPIPGIHHCARRAANRRQDARGFGWREKAVFERSAHASVTLGGAQANPIHGAWGRQSPQDVVWGTGGQATASRAECQLEMTFLAPTFSSAIQMSRQRMRLS